MSVRDQKDGGPAYPSLFDQYPGISFRDLAAIKIMASLVGGAKDWRNGDKQPKSMDDFARLAYIAADAMVRVSRE